MEAELQWRYWQRLYLEKYCVSRGLSSKSIAAYKGDLNMFWEFSKDRLDNMAPSKMKMSDILTYIQYLQSERGNGPSAVNRQVMSIKGFFYAMVSFEEINPNDNPMRDFPKLKPLPQKIPRSLSEEEIKAMVDSCDTSSVVGLRDRTLLILLYGTGIRASECAGLTNCDVDLGNGYIHVTGKGGHQRCVPLKKEVKEALEEYIEVRGKGDEKHSFFISMRGKSLSRNAIYERVRSAGERAGLNKRTSPHKLRHSFATHLIRTERNIQVVSELLGHRHISSTQVYVHIAGHELSEAVSKHPIGTIIERLEKRMEGVRLPFRSHRNKAVGL
jgi:site-specific recombinase XerD